ncbi:MAG: hypothetical protein U5P41_13865 [Gammaproteobacteria bacterium]|nr:hypothetical protein [Gammaproteobacteria bacterium]
MSAIKKLPLLLLFIIGPAVTAQEVVVPEDSMRDAWSDSTAEFESLSSDYDDYSQDSYGYSGLERHNRQKRRSLSDDSNEYEDIDGAGNGDDYELTD